MSPESIIGGLNFSDEIYLMKIGLGFRDIADEAQRIMDGGIYWNDEAPEGVVREIPFLYKEHRAYLKIMEYRGTIRFRVDFCREDKNQRKSPRNKTNVRELKNFVIQRKKSRIPLGSSFLIQRKIRVSSGPEVAISNLMVFLRGN